MSEGEWKDIGSVDEFPEEKAVVREVEGTEILVIRNEGNVCACGNSCTHYGAPLNEGLIHDGIVTCPWHNSRFDIRSGEVLSPPALDDLPSFEGREENGRLLLRRRTGREQTRGTEGTDRTFVILGGGAAGDAAAETLRRGGFAGRVVMITAERFLPYDRPNLSKGFLSGKADEDALPLRSGEFFLNHHIEVMRERTVSSVSPDRKIVRFRDGEELHYDRLLLATGGEPKNLPVPGHDLKGVFLLRSRADAREILSAAEGARRALVVGASFIGMETASCFASQGLEVTVAAPEAVPMENIFGREIGSFLRNLHEKNGVRFRLGTGVEAIEGNGKVERVRLSEGEPVEADLVVVGIGVEPRVGYLEGTGLTEEGEVPVDGRLRTRNPDIFAAGDIASIPYPYYGRSIRIEHWVVAERTGQHAARAMLGDEREFRAIPFFWTMQHGSSLKYIGFGNGYDRIVFRGKVEDGKFLAGYYRGEKLLAAAGLGMSREVMAIWECMERGIVIGADDLADGSKDLAQMVPGAGRPCA